MIDSEIRAELTAILATLAPDTRTALILAAHGCTGAEISTAIGRSSVATRTLMSRARHGLRSQLASNQVAA